MRVDKYMEIETQTLSMKFHHGFGLAPSLKFHSHEVQLSLHKFCIMSLSLPIRNVI